jgi:hypothetical protein
VAPAGQRIEGWELRALAFCRQRTFGAAGAPALDGTADVVAPDTILTTPTSRHWATGRSRRRGSAIARSRVARLYLFGDDAPDVADREQRPRQAWMAERDPFPDG